MRFLLFRGSCCLFLWGLADRWSRFCSVCWPNEAVASVSQIPADSQAQVQSSRSSLSFDLVVAYCLDKEEKKSQRVCSLFLSISLRRLGRSEGRQRCVEYTTEKVLCSRRGRFTGGNMAGLVGRALLDVGAKAALLDNATKLLLLVPVRGKKQFKRPPQKPKKKATVESIMTSIQAKGFLRPYKPYQPANDVAERLARICQSENVSASDETRIDDLLLRFKLFSKCAAEFEHSIPNSRLVDIRTIGDLKEFYNEPVITTTPLNALKNMDLPPNLYVRQEYHRFHPDTDKMFDGKTAFPQSATLVTGLKYKDKYPGYKPEKPWPIKFRDITD